MSESSEDEIEVFTRKIKTLKGIASDLNETIESQNKRIKGINPEMNRMLGRVKGMMSRLFKTDTKAFKAWKYYLIGTTFVFLFIFVFLVLL